MTHGSFSYGYKLGDIHVIHLWGCHVVECAMCDKEVISEGHSVPYYEKPVAFGYSDSYKEVCKRCYLRWEKWNDSLYYYGA